MEFKEILSRIKKRFKSYDSVGLIDDLEVYDWYLESVKKFGALPYELYEEVLEVKNGQAKLPDGFRKLVLAVKCEPHTYKTEEKEHLQESRFWRERHEKIATWNSCDDCCVEESEKFIVEKLYYKGHECKYYYNKPTPLRLTEGINRKMCTSDCANFSVKRSPFEINIIKGKILQANFNEGNIFIRYRGFEEDEDGFVIIPDTFNGHLEKYVEDYICLNLILSLIENNDATKNELSLLSYYRAEVMSGESKAMTELKSRGFNKEALRKYKKRIKSEYKKIEFMF